MEWYAIFIVLHALAASVCLASGLAVIWPQRVRKHPWLFEVFFVSLVALVVFVIAAIVRTGQTLALLQKFRSSG